MVTTWPWSTVLAVALGASAAAHVFGSLACVAAGFSPARRLLRG